jgi:1-phosphofructokinase
VVAVFDPFPVLTVTIESRDGGDELHLHAGGQGVWIGRMAASLGVRIRLVTALGGETGDVLGRLMTTEGIELRPIVACSDSASYVHDRRDGGRSELASVAPAALGRHELDELYEQAVVEASEADAFVLAGPLRGSNLPEGTYRRLSTDVARVQQNVVADLSGGALAEALDGGGIGVLKISHEELIDAGHAAGDSVAELLDGARRVRERGPANVVITRGPENTIALLDGSFVEVVTPTFEPNDQRGGGDALTAALAAGLAEGESLSEALLVGASAAALNVTRRGLASVDPDHVRRLGARSSLRPIKHSTGDDG